MACPPQDITDTELAILRCLWARGPLTTRAIATSLYPRVTRSEYATVQSLLERLEAKSLAVKDRRLRPRVFSAAVPREEVIGRRLRTLAEKFCDGALSPLLTHLVRAARLTPRERAELRALLSETEGSANRGRGAKGAHS